ncbi:unnamed protein product [Cochlearia groenlandica]
MFDSAIDNIKTYLEDLVKERSNTHFPGLILKGLRVIHVEKGIVRCKLIVTHRIMKEDETLHSGAIGMLIELIGAASVYSAGGSHGSIDLNYSLYSTAKIHEEVKIEAKVVMTKEDLNSVVIEIRREYDDELIAIGRLWTRLLTIPFNLNGANQLSKL